MARAPILDAIAKAHPLRRAWRRLRAEAATFRIRRLQARGDPYFTARLFDGLFTRQPDPWRFETSDVAKERMAAMMGLLRSPHLGRLLEIGCAEGWMTEALAERAEAVVAMDISAVAVARTRQRVAHLDNVQVVQRDLVVEGLEGTFDAIVCAGVLVYLPPVAQPLLCREMVAHLADGGHLLLEHQSHRSAGTLSAHDIHGLYHQHPSLRCVGQVTGSEFLVALFKKTF